MNLHSTVVTLTLTVAIVAGISHSSGLAHETGHGPVVGGLGVKGGRLAAIISAKEAELGQKAQIQAVAEWLLLKNELRVFLWNPGRTQRVTLPAGGEIKWILISDAPAPIVKSAPHTEARSTLLIPVTRAELAGIDMIEVILPPSLGDGSAKSVFAIQLKNKNLND